MLSISTTESAIEATALSCVMSNMPLRAASDLISFKISFFVFSSRAEAARPHRSQAWHPSQGNQASGPAVPSSEADAPMSGRGSTCPPCASTPTSRRNTSSSKPPANPQKLPSQPSCVSSSSSQTHCCETAEIGINHLLDENGYSSDAESGPEFAREGSMRVFGSRRVTETDELD